jgi:hypothetical protein
MGDLLSSSAKDLRERYLQRCLISEVSLSHAIATAASAVDIDHAQSPRIEIAAEAAGLSPFSKTWKNRVELIEQ